MARMPIQQHHVDQLKRIYRSQYAKDLSEKDAWAMARRLVSLFQVLCEETNPISPPKTLTPPANRNHDVQSRNLCQKIN